MIAFMHGLLWAGLQDATQIGEKGYFIVADAAYNVIVADAAYKGFQHIITLFD